MSNRFAQLLDEINGLELDKKIEIANILEKSITETSREEFLTDYQKSKSEQHTFSDNIDELKSMLDE